MSTIETQRANGGSLAAVRPEELAGRRARRFSSWARISLATDFVALACALLLAHLAPGPMGVSLGWSIVFGGLVIGLLWTRRMYWPPLDLRMLDAIRSIVVAVAIAAALTTTMRALLTDAPSVGREMIEPWLFGTVFLVAGRILLLTAERRARRRGEGQRTLIVGAGNVGRLVSERLVEHPEVGLTPVAFLDKEPLHGGEVTGLPVFSEGWDLERVVRDQGIEHVILTFSAAPEEVHLRLLKRCDELGIANSLVPRLYEKSTEHVRVVPLGGLPLVARHSPNPRSWVFALKHGVDRLAAAVAILVLSPLLGALALGRLAHVGAADLLPRRAGRPRRQAFRHAEVPDDASDDRRGAHESRRRPEHGDRRHQLNGLDRRTPLGTFMRRTSLDELPQLFNVLKGDMSLVGPRPERTEYVEVYEKEVHRYDERHRVKSGITGLAQVNGLRGMTSLADRAECDNYYIENWSLWLDVKIMVMTFSAVARSANDE